MTLLDVQKAADELTLEDKQGLVTHLLASLPAAPLGPEDSEVEKREREMDSGEVEPITHEEFLAQVGR